ncbi:MAG: hypothetical protein ACFE75_01820 [Candidatus Hodarchaeota archaeon]
MANKKSEGSPDLATLKNQYKEETGKNALHCGKLTKAFQEWKKNKLS